MSLLERLMNRLGSDRPKRSIANARRDPIAELKALNDPSSTRRLAVLLKPYLRKIIITLFMLLALTGVNMAIPMVMKVLVDDVLIEKQMALLWVILGVYLAIYLARNYLYLQSKLSAVAIGEHLAFTLRKRLFERMQQMSLHFYRQTNPGKISSRVMNDSFVVQSFIQDQLPTLLQSALLFLGLVAAIYAMNWPLALAATVVLPFHLLAFRLFRRPIKEASGVAQDQLALVHGNLIEKFLGAEVVKGFTAESRENEAFERAIDTSRESEIRSKRYHVWQKVTADLLVGVGTVLLIGFGAFQVYRDQMSAGDFFAFFGFVMMLYPNLLELMSGFAKLTRTSAGVDRVCELLETDPTEMLSGGQSGEAIRGGIRFENVSFSFEPDQPILRNVDFEVPVGQVCGIVGPSGAGKSTLASLVPRLHDPDGGRVLVDGVDVREYDLRGLREKIGIAFQDCFLFNSSILENLKYANPSASFDQIVATAQRTGAHTFIRKLPNGYRTRIGEGGIALSRGEMQRITLTRAMLKNPRILILDEATASLDVASQEKVIPAILDFMRGKTTLMITHNPALLQHADTVLHLNNGRVTFMGPPETLDEPHRPDKVAPGDPVEEEASGEAGGDDAGGDRDALRGRRGRRSDASGMWPAPLGVLVVAGLILASVTGGVRAQEEPAEPPAEQAAEAQPEARPVEAEMEDGSQVIGRLVPLTGLSEIEAGELIEVAVLQARTELGYSEAGAAMGEQLPTPPEGVQQLTTLAKQSGEAVRLLQVGYKPFRSQPIHVYIVGATLGANGSAVNGDVSNLERLMAEGRETLEAQYAEIDLDDLEMRTIALSYIEADRAMGLLKGLGYQTVEFTAAGDQVGKAQVIKPTSEVDPANLPAVIAMPGSNNTDLVGGSRATGGAFGLTMTPSIASELGEATASAPLMELMVLYHPAHPEQFSRVLDRIRRVIDVPAQQILIEAMVLEISENDLQDMGVQWQLEGDIGNNLTDLKIGRLPNFGSGQEPTLDATIEQVFGEFEVKLKALIREGRAEILSRPSVLTLDNRQASLRVGEELPVATSASGLRGGDRISFDFKYIPVGILLNVRPRIAADNEEVSMQIDGIVSAEVPGQELIIRDSDGDQVASAPRISTRRVQTYARIANNTPFIIGGLVSKDETSTTDKVPFLGDAPLIGPAFRQERTNRTKREVIIVITPYVLPDNKTIGRNMPKDEDAFDSFGNQLFRDAYRIRAEDVFDLSFITDNPQLKEMKRLANLAIRKDFRLAEQYPFNRFVGDRIPGERILVFRQMYEVIKRLNLADRVQNDRIIFFEDDPQDPSGFGVTFLHRFLERHLEREVDWGDPRAVEEAMTAMGDRAIALTYTLQQFTDVSQVLRQPVPEIRMVTCETRDQWSQHLWELNQPDEDGRNRYTILLQNRDDLIRLKRAMLLKRVVQLNANRQALTLGNFATGRLLLMPTVQEDKIGLVDDQTAKYFYFTELYYPALQKELTRDIEALRAGLKQPEVRESIQDEPIPQDEPVVPLGPGGQPRR